MGFRKNSLYVMHPLGTCPLGFSKRPLRVQKQRFRVLDFCEFDAIVNVVFGSDRLIRQLMASAHE